MKAANVGMVMDAIGASGSIDVDAEWLWLTTHADRSDTEATQSSLSVIVTSSVNFWSLDNCKMLIFNKPPFNKSSDRWSIKSSDSEHHIIDLTKGGLCGRCSQNDYKNGILHFDGNGPYISIFGVYASFYTSRISIGPSIWFQALEAPEFLGSDDSSGMLQFSGLHVDNIDLRKCSQVLNSYENPITTKCNKYVDLRSMAKSSDVLKRISEFYSTDCIARFSNGYMKYNGSAWVDYTP